MQMQRRHRLDDPDKLRPPGAVSTSGAYVRVIALALLGGDRSLLLHPGKERRMILVTAVRGRCDGLRRRGSYAIDGLARNVSVRLVSTLDEPKFGST